MKIEISPEVVKQLEESFRRLQEALDAATKHIYEMFQELFAHGTEKEKVSSPKKYGITLNQRRHKEKPAKCQTSVPMRRNLPYQRRSY